MCTGLRNGKSLGFEEHLFSAKYTYSKTRLMWSSLGTNDIIEI
jgi:hypothetical protein